MIEHNIIYFLASGIFTVGFFILFSNNYFIKAIGLTIFQNSILIFYISLGKIKDGLVPIERYNNYIYSNPLPHVLMLTAIVVGFSTLSLSLALISRMLTQFNTVSEKKINEIIAKDANI